MYWRTLKYEDIYLNKYETMPDARIGINKFTNFYNIQRLHSSLEYKTPDEIYYNIVTEVKNTSDKVYLAAGSTDMRKSIDGLAAIVQECFKLDPFTGLDSRTLRKN